MKMLKTPTNNLHYFLLLALVFLLNAGLALAAPDAVLESYVEEAMANSPALAAAESSVEAAQQQISQAGALPDPMVGIGVQNLPSPSFDFQQEPMTGKWISLSQTFPFPGVRSLKRDIAAERVAGKSSEAAQTRLMLVREVQRVYYDWSELRERIRLVEQNRELVKQLVDVTTAAYRVGKGAQQDVLRAQTEWLKYDDQLLELHQQETRLKADFAALLGRGTSAALTEPESISMLPADTLLENSDALTLDHNPELEIYSSKLAASEKQIKLAAREIYPSFSLGARYAQRDASPAGVARDDFWSFQVTTSIPLFASSKQNRLHEQRQIEYRQTQEQYSDLQNRLSADLTDLKSTLRTRQQQAALYSDSIIPQARQTFEAAMSDYSVGRVGYADLIAAQRELFQAQLQYLDRARAYYVTRAELGALTGSSL